MNYNKCSAMLKGGKRPTGMDYKSYAALAKSNGAKPLLKADFMSKAEADDDDDKDDDDAPEGEGDAGGGDDDGESKVPPQFQKGEDDEVDADALSKALTAYETVESATATAGASRETYLTERMQAGTLSKAERIELGTILAGAADEPEEDLIRKSVDEELHDLDPATGDMVDASEFLQNLVKSVDNALTSFGGEISKEFRATRQLQQAQGGLVKALAQDNIRLRKTLRKSAAVIEAVADRLQIVESTPASRKSVATRHDPRSVVARPLNKGAAGGDAIEDDSQPLTKSEIRNGLNELMKSAVANDDAKAIDLIAHETARLESFGAIHDGTMAAIRRLPSNNRSA